jgi:hypothetical protein
MIPAFAPYITKQIRRRLIEANRFDIGCQEAVAANDTTTLCRGGWHV